MTEPTPEVDAGPLIVEPADLARRLGLDPEDDAVIAALTDAIRDAQIDVEAYLGLPVVPQEITEQHLWPWPDGWALHSDYVIEVVDAVAEVYPDTSQPTGYFTVTYTAGLDARTAPDMAPIRRYVREAAMNSPMVVALWQANTGARGEVRSVSADGQSVSYSGANLGGGGTAGSGAPGALPDISSLSRWRKRSVYQRRNTGTFLSPRPWWW